MIHAGIDVTSLIYDRGVSRYTSNLVRALLQRKDVQLSLYGSSWRQKQVLRRKIQTLLRESVVAHQPSRVVVQSLPPSAQHLAWNWFGLNSIRHSLPEIEVFHSWDWLQPPDKDLPLVSTIHDLAMLKFPETAHPQILKMHQISWKKLKERGAQIITVSQATKRDIVELLEFPTRDVHVIYEALPEEVVSVSRELSEEQADRIKRKLQLDQPFVLFVGTREPRKNLERLIEAWQPLAKDFQLIIAGEAGWDDTASGKYSDPNLRFLGKVSDRELAVLYGEASVLAYPSLYEGFGLPILEAFYHGTPVVTSNASSMPEVTGNAAELVDPLSVKSIRQGLETILNESLQEQQKRLQKMVIRMHLFNWETVADQTLQVYKRAIESHL
jgi:glycosyltransferase involved in cell wall biosynthesis